MKITTYTHFIYETDNIPDHRSRRFGCCPCLMAVREFIQLQQKKPYLSGNSDTANAKPTTLESNLFCPFIIPCRSMQSKPGMAVLKYLYLIYKGELT